MTFQGVQGQLAVAGFNPTPLDVAGFLAVKKLADKRVDDLVPVSVVAFTRLLKIVGFKDLLPGRTHSAAEHVRELLVAIAGLSSLVPCRQL